MRELHWSLTSVLSKKFLLQAWCKQWVPSAWNGQSCQVCPLGQSAAETARGLQNRTVIDEQSAVGTLRSIAPHSC